MVLLVAARRRPLALDEPFWPATAGYDRLIGAAPLRDLFLGAAVEAAERLRAWSSTMVATALTEFEWLCAQPFASAEMLRRRLLRRAVAGLPVEVPARLTMPADDHRNAALWRRALPPGRADERPIG